MKLFRFLVWMALAVPLLVAGERTLAEDQPQWGARYSRNLVSEEQNLPRSVDPETGQNVRWVVELGSKSYATPIIAEGRVLIGTNNDPPRDPANRGDRGVLLCLNERDGKVLWHLAAPKREQYNDWPRVGIVSPPTVEQGRVYLTSNRGEVLCLDLNGQADGNDGPFTDEANYFVPAGSPPIEIGPQHADIIWKFDMFAELGVQTHDQMHSSPLIHGDVLYVGTSNGVDESHRRVAAPDAPSLIALDKKTGRLLARDREPIGEHITHCTWSSPSLGTIGGRTLVFFGGGNAICYAFEAIDSVPEGDEVATLKKVWQYDCDPDSPRGRLSVYQENRRTGPSTITGMPVVDQGRVYVTSGGDFWHGKLECWLHAIDANGSGDITQSGRLWASPLRRHCMSTPSIRDGLAYIADCGRQVSCIDTQTGEPVWVHRAEGEIWGSTMVADGKVYVGSVRGDFWILAAGREHEVLARVDLDDPIHSTPTAGNGTLYVATMRRLFAFAESASPAEQGR